MDNKGDALEADEPDLATAAAIAEAVPDEFQDTARTLLLQVADAARRRPLLAMLIAAFVGYLAAKLMRNRQHN